MHLCPSATCDVSEHVIRHNVIIHLVDVSRMQACLRVRESELVAPCTFLAFFEGWRCTRAEVRGTTVYASDTLPLGDIEGISG